MSLTIQITKPDKIFENKMHKLNTKLQTALLKWKINSIEKRLNLNFSHVLENLIAI